MMRARHTQARRRRVAITSNALVNRARMKVVKMKLTKYFLKTAPKTQCRPGERRANAGTHNHRWLWLARRVHEWLIPSASLKRSVWVPAFAGRTPGRRGELRLPRSRLAQRGLRGGEAGDRHAVGRAGHVVEPDLVTERHRGGIAAVLA